MFTVASTFLKPRYLESPAISNPGYLESPTILNPVISDPPLSQTTVISNPLLHLYLKPRLSQFPCGLKPWLSRISTYLEPQWSQIPCCLNQTLAISNSHLQNPGTLDPTYLKPGYLESLLSRTPAISNPPLSGIPHYLELELIPLAYVLTYLLLPISNSRYLEQFLFSLARSR